MNEKKNTSVCLVSVGFGCRIIVARRTSTILKYGEFQNEWMIQKWKKRRENPHSGFFLFSVTSKRSQHTESNTPIETESPSRPVQYTNISFKWLCCLLAFVFICLFFSSTSSLLLLSSSTSSLSHALIRPDNVLASYCLFFSVTAFLCARVLCTPRLNCFFCVLIWFLCV